MKTDQPLLAAFVTASLACLLVMAASSAGCVVEGGTAAPSAGSDDAGGAPNAASDPDASGRDPDTRSGADAPRFLSFSTNVTTLDDKGNVVFTAIVTDPQGIDDLIGGTLRSPTGAAYGAFVSGAQEGAYQITLRWPDIGQVTPFSFAAGEVAKAKFVAEFFDQAGNSATSTVEISLACADKGAACDGVCIDLATDADHCGTCGNKCPDSACSGGKCAAWGCFSSDLLLGQALTCNIVCQSAGKTCISGCGPNHRAAGKSKSATCSAVSGTANTCSGSLSHATADAFTACCCV